MSGHEEGVFFSYITETAMLDIMLQEGFLSEDMREIFPTELMRKIVHWALDYYLRSSMKLAPTKEGLLETWADEMEKVDLVLDEYETDSLQWAIDELRSKFVSYRSQRFVHEFAQAITKADSPDKAKVAAEYRAQFDQIVKVANRTGTSVDPVYSVKKALQRHEDAVAANQEIRGLTFGLPLVDEHLRGIQPGELCVFAAASGVGKSWWGVWTAVQQFKRKRKTALYTLENDVNATWSRFICLHAKIEFTKWEREELDAGERKRVSELIEEIEGADYAPHISQPTQDLRAPGDLVADAMVNGATSLIIDQTSFLTKPTGYRAKHEAVGELILDLKARISDGGVALPTLLLHQISRDGQKEAKKNSRLDMTALADSTMVEQTADFVLGLRPEENSRGEIEHHLELLKQRRVTSAKWEMSWRVGKADIRARSRTADGTTVFAAGRPLNVRPTLTVVK